MSSFDSNVGSQYKFVPTYLSELLMRCIYTLDRDESDWSYLPLTENPSLVELTNELGSLFAIVLKDGAARHKDIDVKSQKYSRNCMVRTDRPLEGRTEVTCW